MPLLGGERALYGPLIVLALVIVALVLGKELLVPLTIGAGLAFILTPIVVWLSRHWVPRPLAIVGVVAALLALSASAVVVVSGQLLSLTEDLATYEYNLVHKVRSVADAAKSSGALQRAAGALSRLEADIGAELKAPPAAPATIPTPSVAPAGPPNPPAQPAVAPSGEVTPSNGAVSASLFAWLQAMAPVGLALLFAVFMLFQSEDIRDRLVRLVGMDNVSGTTAALADAAERLSRLLLAQASVNLAFGTAIAAALWVIGVPNSALWGAFAFFGRFVPYVGGFVSGIPPVLLAAAVDPGWGMAIATAAVFAVGELTMSQAVEPMLLGAKAGLSPLAMLISSGFWALVWGPAGLILAAPLTLTLVVLGRYFRGLEFLTVLLGDSPALSPSQQLYRRLLGDDSLAAINQIEKAGLELGLTGIGDAIVLPALHLAAMDLEAGRIAKERAAQLSLTMTEVASHLVPAATGRDASAQSAAPMRVLVVPARGVIDVSAADFVARAIQTNRPAVSATALAQFTGLSAIAQSSGTGGEPVDIVVIVSVGAAEYLALIARRAANSFHGTRILVLDLSAGDVAVPSGVISHARLADLMDHFDANPAPLKEGAAQKVAVDPLEPNAPTNVGPLFVPSPLGEGMKRRKGIQMGSTTDKIAGVANEAAGKLKQGVGNLVGSEKLKTEGAIQEVKGDAQKAMGDAKDAIKKGADHVADAAHKKL